MPFNPHNLSFNTTTNFWSVVAVAPPAGTDYDLDLFTDKAQQSNQKSSTMGAGLVDFVAIDSNQGKQPLGDWYPRVRRFNNVGSGVATIELAQGSQSLALGATKAIAMPATDLADVWDVFISQNTQVQITFSASAGFFQAFLFTSASGGFIKARNQAVANTATIASGSPQTLTFTPGAGAGGWHGLVILRTGGAGTDEGESWLVMESGSITTRSRSPAPYPGVPVGFRVGSPGSPRLTMGFPSPESTRSPRRPRYCVLIGTHGFRLSSPPPDGSCCSFSDPITALRVVTQTPT